MSEMGNMEDRALGNRDGADVKDAATPIIVALDGMGESAAVELARNLRGRTWGTKINDLLLRCGVEIVPRLKAYGQVFCDVKLHDIPNTVAHQVALLERAGADLITVHCSGGPDMLRAAMEARTGGVRLLGVTVLTAISNAVSRAVYGQETEAQVEKLAEMALEAGLDGIVCSPVELALAKKIDPGHKLLRVTPGVRPGWYAAQDDQNRTSSPAAAMAGGADLLVIGRPITTAEDPLDACGRIAGEIGVTGR